MRVQIASHFGVEDVRALLDHGRAEEALHLVNTHDPGGAEWQNVRGVCLLRLGKFDKAAAVFRNLVFPNGSIAVADDVPALYRANFATAMLLSGNMDAGLSVLDDVQSNGHPYVEQVLTSVHRWEKSLGVTRRILYRLGWYPRKPVDMDFPPGGF